jgi:hypothetical protein
MQQMAVLFPRRKLRLSMLNPLEQASIDDSVERDTARAVDNTSSVEQVERYAVRSIPEFNYV